jgi:hypothetical protein
VLDVEGFIDLAHSADADAADQPKALGSAKFPANILQPAPISARVSNGRARLSPATFSWASNRRRVPRRRAKMNSLIFRFFHVAILFVFFRHTSSHSNAAERDGENKLTSMVFFE